ncbi:MAG: ACT domain-containing protein [Candidatus Dormibacterales bacterium]
MISTSEIRITCIVGRDRVAEGVRALHRAFDLDRETEPVLTGPERPAAPPRGAGRG